MKPVTIAETENNRKKLEPINPNWRGLSWSSCMIGTAAIPITALSAKLISMNRNNRATISQAPFGVSVWWILVLARPPEFRRQRASFWTEKPGHSWGTPCRFRVPDRTFNYGTDGYQGKMIFEAHEKVRHPRSVLRRKSYARPHPGRRVYGLLGRRLCRYQHARNREAR